MRNLCLAKRTNLKAELKHHQDDPFHGLISEVISGLAPGLSQAFSLSSNSRSHMVEDSCPLISKCITGPQNHKHTNQQTNKSFCFASGPLLMWVVSRAHKWHLWEGGSTHAESLPGLEADWLAKMHCFPISQQYASSQERRSESCAKKQGRIKGNWMFLKFCHSNQSYRHCLRSLNKHPGEQRTITGLNCTCSGKTSLQVS
eukprot:XP_017449930.1 PREDICTED: uncharacterized protein LOC102557478 isoform X2 [Rattus norvegicus]